jgi:hypothetical protein
MRAEFAVQELASKKVTDVQQAIEMMATKQLQQMSRARGADITPPPGFHAVTTEGNPNE